MPSLNSIKQRTESVRKVVKVTGIVKLIATSKLSHSRSAAIQSHKFFVESQKILALLLKHTNTKSLHINNTGIAILRQLKLTSNDVFIVAFGSNKGLCGSLNSSIARLVINHVETTIQNNPSAKITIFIIGKQIFSPLRSLSNKANITLQEAHELYDEKLSVEQTSLKYKAMFESFLNSSASDILFFYNRFISALNQTPSILSLREEFLYSRKKVDVSASKKPLADIPMATILGKATENFLFATINYLLKQQIASEYALKMKSMENANKNGHRLQSDLKLQYNKLRQSKITTELIDIIGGVEAMIKS